MSHNDTQNKTLPSHFDPFVVGATDSRSAVDFNTESYSATNSNLMDFSDQLTNQMTSYDETSYDWTSTTLRATNETSYTDTTLTIGLSCGSALFLFMTVVVTTLVVKYLRRRAKEEKEPSVRGLTLYDSLSIDRSPVIIKSINSQSKYSEYRNTSERNSSIGKLNHSFINSCSPVERISKCEEVYQLKPLSERNSYNRDCYSPISEILGSDGDSFILKPTGCSDSVDYAEAKNAESKGDENIPTRKYLPGLSNVTLEQVLSNVRRIHRLTSSTAAVIAALRVSESSVPSCIPPFPNLSSTPLNIPSTSSSAEPTGLSSGAELGAKVKDKSDAIIVYQDRSTV